MGPGTRVALRMAWGEDGPGHRGMEGVEDWGTQGPGGVGMEPQQGAGFGWAAVGSLGVCGMWGEGQRRASLVLEVKQASGKQ